MSPARPGFRRVCALLACAALVATASACDSGGSSKSDAGTTTTTKKRKPRASTTTSSSSSSTSSTTGTPGTTAPTLPPTTTPPGTTTPCGAQAARISSVVYGGDLQPVPVDSYTIADCRLAPSSPIWGAVVLTPKPGQTVPQLTVVVELLGSIWTVHSYGAGPTGCDAPAPVPAELHLGC